MKMYKKRTASDVELELRPSGQQRCFSDTLKKEGSGQRGTVTQNERQNCKYKQKKRKAHNRRALRDTGRNTTWPEKYGQNAKCRAADDQHKAVRKHTDHQCTMCIL